MPPFPERESSILAKLKKKKGPGNLPVIDDSRRNINGNDSAEHDNNEPEETVNKVKPSLAHISLGKAFTTSLTLWLRKSVFSPAYFLDLLTSSPLLKPLFFSSLSIILVFSISLLLHWCLTFFQQTDRALHTLVPSYSLLGPWYTCIFAN